jgi:large subunit ribosomal protein L28
MQRIGEGPPPMKADWGGSPANESGFRRVPRKGWEVFGTNRSLLSSRISPGVPLLMSYRCEVCGKEPSYGKTVSFSHKRNNRRWLPNIQIVRVKHGSNTRRARVCASCIRAGKIEKA